MLGAAWLLAAAASAHAQADAAAGPPARAVPPNPPRLPAGFDARAADVDAPPLFAAGAPWAPLVAVDWEHPAATAGTGAWVRTAWNRRGLRVALVLPPAPNTTPGGPRRRPPFDVRLGFVGGRGPYEVRCEPLAEPLTRMTRERAQLVLFNGRVGANARLGEAGHAICEELTLRGTPPDSLRTRWRGGAGDTLRFDAFVPWAALGLRVPAAGGDVPLRLTVGRAGHAPLAWGDSSRLGAVRLLAGPATPADSARALPIVAGPVRQPAVVAAAFPAPGLPAARAGAFTFALVDAAGRVRARAAAVPRGDVLRADLSTAGLTDGAYAVRVASGPAALGETMVRLVGSAAAGADSAWGAVKRRIDAVAARLAAHPDAPASADGHLARARAALALAALPAHPDLAALARSARLVADARAVADAVDAGRRPDASHEGYGHPAGFAADGARGPVTFVPVRGDRARVTIDAARPVAWRLTPRLYGTFSEPVDYDRPIYSWLDAQRVRNPGFRWGHPSAEQTAHDFARGGELDSAEARAALAGEWLPRIAASTDSIASPWIGVGAPAPARQATFAIACDTAAGRACQRVDAPAGARGAGVAQVLSLPTWRETRYRLHAVLRAAQGASAARVLLYHAGRVVDSARLAAVPRVPNAPGLAGDTAWRTVDAELRAPHTTGPANAFLLAVVFDGPGRLDLRKVTLYPADADHGFDPQAVAQLAALRTGWVRWPGGNYASAYHWRDGIGPRDERPSTPNYSWQGLNDNAVGTDEFLPLAARAGFDVLLTVNAGTGTPDEAAAWVQYIDGDTTTPMGRLRARNGHPAPYGIKYWNVGNELWGHWQHGYTDPAGYAERYARFSAAMRAADPSITLVANAHGGHSESPPEPWNDALLARNGADVQVMDLHTYVGVPPDSGVSAADRAFLLSAIPLSYEQWIMEFARSVRARGLTRARAIVGEYNAHVGTRDSAVDRAGDLLATAAYLHAFVRQGDFVVGANATEYSPFDPRALPFGRMHPRFDLFRTWAAHLGTQPLATTVETPVVQQARRVGRDVVPIFNLPLVDAVAVRDTATGAVAASLINRDMARAIAVDVRVDAFAPSGGARWYVLRGDPGAGVEERAPTAGAGGVITVVLPPRSASLLTVPGARRAAGAATHDPGARTP